MNAPILSPAERAALLPFFSRVDALPPATQPAQYDAIAAVLETLQRLDTLEPADRAMMLDWRHSMTPALWVETVQLATFYEDWRKQQPLQ